MIGQKVYDFIERTGGLEYVNHIKILEKFLDSNEDVNFENYMGFANKNSSLHLKDEVFFNRGQLECNIHQLKKSRLLAVQTYASPDEFKLIVFPNENNFSLPDELNGDYKEIGFKSIYSDMQNFENNLNDLKRIPRSSLLYDIHLKKKLFGSQLKKSKDPRTGYCSDSFSVPFYQIKNIIGLNGNSEEGRHVLCTIGFSGLKDRDKNKIKGFSEIINFIQSPQGNF